MGKCSVISAEELPGDQYALFLSLRLPHLQTLKEHPGPGVSIGSSEKFYMAVVLQSVCWPLSTITPIWTWLMSSGNFCYLMFVLLTPLPSHFLFLLPGRDPGRAVCSRWASPPPLPWKSMDKAYELAAQHHVPILWCLRNHWYAHLPLLQHCAPGGRQTGFGYGSIQWR